MTSRERVHGFTQATTLQYHLVLHGDQDMNGRTSHMDLRGQVETVYYFQITIQLENGEIMDAMIIGFPFVSWTYELC